MSQSIMSLRMSSRRWSSLTIRRRGFCSTGRLLVNPLLDLSRFSFSKEAQYFSKERKIPREEFSPILELIRSSEVDPFAPAPGASPTVIAALRRAQQGESDMQTAFSLAISNLVVQLETSKAEAKKALDALNALQEKHQRQERHALFMVFGIVAFVSVTFFKPDALNIISEELQEIQRSWRQFDWQWLGNPPEHKSSTTNPRAKHVDSFSDHMTPQKNSSGAMEKVKELGPVSEAAVISSTRMDNDKAFSLTRLFWASNVDT